MTLLMLAVSVATQFADKATEPPSQLDTVLPVANSLSALLTAESFVFAALAASVALSSDTGAGRPIVGSLFAFGIAVAVLISVVALGAFGAWWQAFHDFPSVHTQTRFFEAVGLLAAIICQAAFAWWIALALRGR